MADEESPSLAMWGVATGGTLKSVGDYDPEITPELDAQIRNMPLVEQYCLQKADELLKSIGSKNFEIVLSTMRGGDVYSEGTDVGGHRRHLRGGGDAGQTTKHPEKQRVRAYVVPANSEGIAEELKDAVLLKAALGMAGK